ncbi:MAG: hypothetical protein JNG83_03270 [Opitutaceae bacterium]|nr:hypothetical protein [Opitutaceae bacterium]
MKTTPSFRQARLGAGLCLLSLSAAVAVSADVLQLRPLHRTERVLVPSDPAAERHYLAFPDVLDLGDEVLVSFKRGRAHGDDAGAVIDTVRIDKATDRVAAPQVIAGLGDKIMQMGEWVRFPNGDIGNYIDAQQVDDPARIGLRGVRSTDGGRTFGPLTRVGPVDGIEYGYPFEFVVEGTTTWMLVMTFANLQGGYSVHPPRPQAGAVDILRSEDSGRSWRFVRNLSREFGNIPINESSFVRYADGFLVVTRGYDNRARLHLTDNEFKVRKQADLTETYDFIEGYVGRPRVFMRDGQYYLIGRNWTVSTAAAASVPKDGVPNFPAAMKLCLFRLDPAALAVTAYAVLDNADGGNVTDAYYPVPYFREAGGRTYLRVVDYKGMNRRPPQIVEFEYLWDEVK